MTSHCGERPYESGQVCPICDMGHLQVELAPQVFTYKDRETTLSVERFVCSSCREEILDDVAMDKVEPALRKWRREVDGLLSGEEIRSLRKSLGATQRQMSLIFGSGPKSFAKYEAVTVNQSHAMDTILRAIARQPGILYRLAQQRGVELEHARQRLLLVWKNPESRQRYLIGHLLRDKRGYHFQYESQLPRSLHDACGAGFSLIEGFGNPKGQWSSPCLFSLFARRLPAGEMDCVLAELALALDPSMEYLRKTGGRLPTDSLEFLESIEEDQGATEYRVTFPVAGWRYYDGEGCVGELCEGARLRLELEPDNQHDPNAVRILSPSGRKIGYVPAVYAWYIDESVASGQYVAEVRTLGPAEDPQIRVVVDFSAAMRDKPLWYWRISDVSRVCGTVLPV